MTSNQNQTGGGNAANPEIKCPINGGDLGDKSPEGVAWWFETHPAEAAKRYEGRKLPSFVMCTREILERQIDALTTSELLAIPGDINPLGVTEFRTLTVPTTQAIDPSAVEDIIDGMKLAQSQSLQPSEIVAILTKDGTTRLNKLAAELQVEAAEIRALDGQGFTVQTGGWVKLNEGGEA